MRSGLLANDDTLAMVEEDVEPAYDLYTNNGFIAQKSNGSLNWRESTKLYGARVVWSNNPAVVRQSPTFISFYMART